MAIAYDNSAKGGTTSGTSVTFSHTCAGSDRVLVVFVRNYRNGDNITGVTYGGTSMTKVMGVKETSATTHGYLFILANPSTGANNVVVSASGTSYIAATSHSYTGCATTSIPDAYNSLNTTSTTVTTSVTTTVDNCWLVGSFFGARAYSAGSGTTVRQSSTTADYTYSFDSNAAKSPAGSYSLAGTQASSGDSVNLIVSLAPAVAATSSIKSIAGVAIADLKSLAGVAKADIKSVAGVSNVS